MDQTKTEREQPPRRWQGVGRPNHWLHPILTPKLFAGLNVSSDSLALLDFLNLDEPVQMPQSRGMAHLAQCLGLDLPNSFSRNTELFTDFFQCPWRAVAQTKAQFEHLALPFREAGQHVTQFIFQEAEACNLGRIFRPLVFDEITKIGLVRVTDRRLQGNGLLRHFDNGANALDR